MQVHIVLEGDGSCEPDATGHDKVASTALADATHGEVEFLGVVVVSVTACAVFGDAFRKVLEGGTLNLCHLEGQSFGVMT